MKTKTFKQLMEEFNPHWAPTKEAGTISVHSAGSYHKHFHPSEMTGFKSSYLEEKGMFPYTAVTRVTSPEKAPGTTIFGKKPSVIRDEAETLDNHYHQNQEDHKKIIQHYTGSGSEDINGHILRVAESDIPYHKEAPEPIDRHADMPNVDMLHRIHHLDHAVHHTTTPHDMTVYSGISNKHSNRNKMVESSFNHPDKLFTSKGFMSTSIDPHIPFSFTSGMGARVMAIHVPKGHPGVYAGKTSLLSHEKEFILPRNSLFQHIKMEQVSCDHPDLDEKLDKNSEHIVHHVRLIHPDDYHKYGHDPYSEKP